MNVYVAVIVVFTGMVFAYILGYSLFFGGRREKLEEIKYDLIKESKKVQRLISRVGELQRELYESEDELNRSKDRCVELAGEYRRVIKIDVRLRNE